MPLIISRSWVSRYLATSQPLSISPTTFSFSTRTSSKKVSQNGDLPEINRIGRVVTPFVAMSNRTKLMPLCLARRRIGAHETENPIGLVGVARPDFLAVDDEMIASVLGARCERGEIGSGVRLGITLAPADFAAHDRRQKFLLLRFRPIFQ